MSNIFSTETLASLGVEVATLGVGQYALPVRFRISGAAVECRVPTWVSVSDLIDQAGEVTLVVAADMPPDLRWAFLRGPAVVLEKPDWSGLETRSRDRAIMDDLYQLVRVEPRRIELIDERRGWGYRETVDS